MLIKALIAAVVALALACGLLWWQLDGKTEEVGTLTQANRTLAGTIDAKDREIIANKGALADWKAMLADAHRRAGEDDARRAALETELQTLRQQADAAERKFDTYRRTKRNDPTYCGAAIIPDAAVQRLRDAAGVPAAGNR